MQVTKLQEAPVVEVKLTQYEVDALMNFIGNTSWSQRTRIRKESNAKTPYLDTEQKVFSDLYDKLISYSKHNN
jgi:hypothetical protein